MAKTKRNKIVVVCSEKSITDADLSKRYYTEYRIAKAIKVKDGIVLQVQYPHDNAKYELVEGFQACMVINDPEKQAQAQRFYDTVPYGADRFESIDDIRNAILAS